MARRSGFLLALSCLLALVPAPGAVHAQAQPQSQTEAQPRDHGQRSIITGTRQTSMDAPDTNGDLETYTHSPVVQAVAKRLGLTTNQASRYFEDFNSGVLIAVVLYFALKYLPGRLKAKRREIEDSLVRARQATVDAEARLKRIESRLAALGGEVDALRREAEEASRAEETRIHASLEEERQRIVRSAEAEVQAAQAAAERGLKRYAAGLAVDRAAGRLRVTPEADRALVDDFLAGLEAKLARESGAPNNGAETGSASNPVSRAAFDGGSSQRGQG